MRIPLLLIFLYCGAIEARQITGRILDSETQKPVRNANVILFNTTQGTITNHLGFFSLTITSEDSELVISSKGYQTSKIKVPEQDQFKILLNREYLLLPEFDLRWFIKADLPTPEIKEESKLDNLLMETDAEYPGGWEYFYNDLGALLKMDSFSTHFSDSVELVEFSVSPQGKITEIQLKPINEKLKLLLTTAMDSLTTWRPAYQNKIKVAQYYSLPIKWSKSDSVIFSIVEESATPVNGMAALYEFVGTNIRYPPEARRLGIEGRVFVEFTVNRDGSLSDFRVIKGIGGGCDGEAVRALSLSPNWIPAMQKGLPVRQKMVMPIIFKLDGIPKVTREISENDILYDFYNWVGGTIRYPAEARKMGIEGWVYAEIKIDKNTGEINNYKLLNDIGGDCGKEVLRVIGTISPIAVMNLRLHKETLILPVVFGLGSIRNVEAKIINYPVDAELLKPIKVVAIGIQQERRVIGYSKDLMTTPLPLPTSTPKPQPKSFSEIEKKAKNITLVGKGIVSIPANIKEYKNLKSLDLENNLIEHIPNELTQTGITALFMPINRLKELPDEFANLQSLVVLGLAQNQFSEFPISITKLKAIKALDLSENKIELIPEEIENLSSLEELYLRNNKIKTLPESIYKLTKLKKLYLEGNPISEEEKISVKQRLDKTEVLF